MSAQHDEPRKAKTMKTHPDADIRDLRCAAGHPRRCALAAMSLRATKVLTGDFVYSVRTTGVYCKPSCAARALRDPKMLRFHARRPPMRERAGFPCPVKRCRPDSVNSADQALTPLRSQAACRIASRRRKSRRNLKTLAAKGTGLSPHHFHRVFQDGDRRDAARLCQRASYAQNACMTACGAGATA